MPADNLQDEANASATKVVVLPCDDKHFFHTECIISWLVKKPLCPLCRANVCPPQFDHRDKNTMELVKRSEDVRRGEEAEEDYDSGTTSSDDEDDDDEGYYADDTHVALNHAGLEDS